MKQEFTTYDYVQAIKREQLKRSTTYPKIIKKMQKGGVELQEIVNRKMAMNWQENCLQYALYTIEGYLPDRQSFLSDALDELIRELKMRKHYYPRLIYFKRLDEQTAAYELSVWESLTRWFAKEFLDLDELPTKRKKK